jgi:hypothetical protein
MTLHAHQGGPREQQQQRIIYLFGKHSVQFPVSLGSRSSPAGGRAVKSPSAAPPQPAAQRRRAGCPTRQTSGGGGVRSHHSTFWTRRVSKKIEPQNVSRAKSWPPGMQRERETKWWTLCCCCCWQLPTIKSSVTHTEKSLRAPCQRGSNRRWKSAERRTFDITHWICSPRRPKAAGAVIFSGPPPATRRSDFLRANWAAHAGISRLICISAGAEAYFWTRAPAAPMPAWSGPRRRPSLFTTN